MMNIDKIHLYATLLPFNLKMALAFFPGETIGDIHFFIEETMRKLRIKFKIGRIEKKENSAWILPQYKISEFLKDGDEIEVYSLEYGLTKSELTSSTPDPDEIDNGFIGKKTKRKIDDENKSSLLLTPKLKKNNLKEKLKKKEESSKENDSEHSKKSKSNEESENEKKDSDKEDEDEPEESKEEKKEEEDDEEDDEEDKEKQSEEDEANSDEEDIQI